MFLGNINGKFTWDKRIFKESARGVSLGGSVLSAELRKIDGSWSNDVFDLRDLLLNNNGAFQAVNG
jgi:hypothetical protein